MDEQLCPACHVAVRPTDYFCYNCGKNLHTKPPSTTASSQALIYIGSVVLPPMGFIWGFRYLRVQDPKSKKIGIIAMVLTSISLILGTIWTVQFINSVNTQVNKQLQIYQGF